MVDSIEFTVNSNKTTILFHYILIYIFLRTNFVAICKCFQLEILQSIVKSFFLVHKVKKINNNTINAKLYFL